MAGERTLPDAKCPIRPGDACSLCQPGATGPQDCGLVYLVMSDPDLREELNRVRRYERDEARRKTERPVASTQAPDRSAVHAPLNVAVRGDRSPVHARPAPSGSAGP